MRNRIGRLSGAPTFAVGRAVTQAAGVLAVGVLTVALLSCGSDDGKRSEGGVDDASARAETSGVDTSAARPAKTFEVGRRERTFVDTTRPTAAHGGRPELPSRTQRTLVLYPADGAGEGAAPLEGAWPMIVFSHGSTRAGIDYVDTLSWWASAGYVVVAPSFPLSSTGTPGGTAYGDYENQTEDVSFVIDSVTADKEPVVSEGPPLGELVDPDRVGAGGQSFGAITTLGVVAAECCADPRIKVATEFAGMLLPFSSGTAIATTVADVPILFVHGNEDPAVAYDAGRTAFSTIGAPGGFLTLVDTGHDDGYFDGGSTDLDRLVSESTLAFYDAVLKPKGAEGTGVERVKALADDAGPTVGTFEISPAD